MCRHHMCKYISTSYLGQRLSVRNDWGLHPSHIMYCFSDKRYEKVGHIPRTICSAMIAVFVSISTRKLLNYMLLLHC